MRAVFVSIALLLCLITGNANPAFAQTNLVTVTILYDNYAVEDRFETDWGFADPRLTTWLPRPLIEQTA